MLIKEYRVPLPLTVDEYQIGQLYGVADMSKRQTGGGEGIEIIKNEPFKDFPLLGGKYTSGQYTHKIYHLESKVPAFIRLLAPKGSLEVHEEAWNAYPYLRTVLTNPGFMKENFCICIESLHLPDTGDQHNVHELPADKLKVREVVYIDIANDPLPAEDYRLETDPAKYKSHKTGRGPLVGPNWRKEATPLMTCYKLVTAEFKWFGLQSRAEDIIQKSERRLFTIFHRQVFCSMDDWFGMSMEDIRVVEDRTKNELEKLRNVGEIRGMCADE